MLDVTAPPALSDRSGLFTSRKGAKSNVFNAQLQRADGTGKIVLVGSETGTRILDVYHRSPLRVMFPRTRRHSVEEAVLINTSGGVAGGDRLEWRVVALADASIAVTSQAAEKIYRALAEPAHISTHLAAGNRAKLAWLPQETIVFNGARLNRETVIEASSDSEVLALEWIVLGRAARNESVTSGQIIDTWRVKKGGRLVWADTFRVFDETFAHLHRRALLSECIAIATVIYSAPDLDRRLDFLRNFAGAAECRCAVTLVNGLVVIRFAANAASDLRASLCRLLQQLSGELEPGPFRVPRMWSC